MTCLPLEQHRSACVSAMRILFSFTGCEFSDKGELMVGLNRERKPQDLPLLLLCTESIGFGDEWFRSLLVAGHLGVHLKYKHSRH